MREKFLQSPAANNGPYQKSDHQFKDKPILQNVKNDGKPVHHPPLHLLCRCPALACKRYRSWGHMFMTPKDLEDAKVNNLISLVNDTRLDSTE
ncbi:hypothetical protein ALC62_11806 [Cyphomyrmex costatus]|uniref:Uncharacterized protein n=1 Tax=Cyphomyrmex costatus TaxID=456900 RepID=A0A195C9L6_9HYME|nr:hypothetical protein ALC62_11806 [Cyphomyrmex costatus]